MNISKAKSVLQGFVDNFCRRCDPSQYPYSHESFEDWVRVCKAETLNQIHGAVMLLIAFDLAVPLTDYEVYNDQVEQYAQQFLKQFKPGDYARSPAGAPGSAVGQG
jgi:hypothetical protein